MKRVCLLTDWPDLRYSYPTIQHTLDLLAGQEVATFVFSPSPQYREELQRQHRYQWIGYQPRLAGLKRVGSIEFIAQALIRVGRCAVYMGMGPIGLAAAYLLSRWYRGSTLVAYMPELEPGGSRWHWRANALIGEADAIVDVDPNRLEYRLSQWPSRAHTFCLPNVPLRREAEGRPAGRVNKQTPPVLWYHGSLSPVHGLDELLEGFRLAQAECELHLTGSYPDVHYRELLEAHVQSVGRRVCVHPPQPRDEVLERAWRLAEVGVAFYPFRHQPENVALRYANPAKVFDYMALGLPTLASDNPSLVSLVEHQGWGVCVPPEDPVAVAEAIDGLLRDASRRAQMSVRAQELFLSEYHLEKMAQPFLEWLHDWMSRRAL